MMRQFERGGRKWTALCPNIPESGSVLRFSSHDGLIFDLGDCPSHWESLSEEELGELLKKAVMLTSRLSITRMGAIY